MKKITYFGIIAATLGFLVSCGANETQSSTTTETTQSKKLQFPLEYKSDKPVVQADEFKIGIVTSSPFKGIYSVLHSDDSVDINIVDYLAPELYAKNEDFESIGVEGGFATYTIDVENKVVDFKFKEGLKWSDGEPLTVDDLIFTIEVLSSKEYTGSRFDIEEHGKIIGLLDYRDGKADHISGLEKISDTELKVHVTEVSTAMAIGGGPIQMFERVMPKHYLSDVPIKDLASSPKTRLNPLSYGPYILKDIVPGESLYLEANPYYYLGEAPIKKLYFKTLSPETFVESIKNGEYHSYYDPPQSSYEKYKDLNNITLLGKPDLYYSYISFNLGHWDNEKSINVQDRDTPLQDKRIRQAIGYSLDMDTITTAFYNGLRFRATQIVPEIFSKYYDDSSVGYPHDLEKAKALLKEAGYEDKDGDGFVEKDGKALVLNFATMSGSDIAEPLTQAMIQNMNEAGIKVELTTGRLIDYNLFYDKVEANDNDIDMFAAAWGVGTSLNFKSLYGSYGFLNFARYSDSENDKLLNAIDDVKGLEDPNYRPDAFKKWQKYFMEQAVAIPLTHRIGIVPVNLSIKYANLYNDSARNTYFNELVQKEPTKATN